jgi:peptidoglycan-synthase activator LpoB
MLQRIIRALFAPVVLLACVSLSGCTVAGLIADKFSGDPQVPAQYVPQKDFMLVLVESYQNPSSIAIASEQLDRQIANDLIAHKVAPIINPDRLSEARLRNPSAYKEMDIAGIGRSFGAKQVLYVDIKHFDVDDAVGGQMVKATAEARVRVVDASTGKTLWPLESQAGYPVSFQSPFVAIKEGVTETSVRDQATRALGERIAKLFFTSTEESEPSTQLSMGN